ncbi:hypothetical protein [Streptomyces sp. NPDC013489]|uniref:hypothetical protein n=1 Tax=Streptomyces sp. NPDC013489 TaxID=3155606 RepID=UPI0033F0490F
MHHRPRTTSTQAATLTIRAAYEGAVTRTSARNSALTCPSRGVRFGAYNGGVTKTPVLQSTTTDLSTAAAKAVAK